ncbi:MAG: hypothetical protein HUU47_03960 [Bacteroidetes bacterium]|nr:hypothetical protein [Bacteroidota bacterium]
MIISNSKRLRQRVINLLYLIFLAFIYILIPSDFVDSTFHSNKSLEQLNKEIDVLSTNNNIYFLTILKNDPAVFEETKQKFIKIESISQVPLSTISRYKKELIGIDGTNKFGFYNKGRAELSSNRFFIYEDKADSLFKILKVFKDQISDYISYKDLDYLNELLPLKDYERNSSGNFILSSKYFFSKTPLNVSLLNLSHFESRVERIKIRTLQKIIKQVIVENNAMPQELSQAILSNSINSNNNSQQNVTKFYEKFKKEFEIIAVQNKNLPVPAPQKDSTIKPPQVSKAMFIETLTDSIHPIGKPIRFFIGFDDKSSQNILVNIFSNYETKTITYSKPSEFIYFPLKKGSYKFSFDNGIKKVIKEIRVIDIEPIIQNTKLPTLYIGIDNPLKIKITEYNVKDNLIASISDGVILKRGDVFYARVNKKGIVKAEIFANLPYGKVKVAEQQFTVRELQKPIPFINKTYNGDEVTENDLKEFKKINLKTDEYLVNEEVYVAEFDFMKIYNNESAVLKPLKNIGSSFNSTIYKIIKASKAGDILIFTNIKTKSSLGTETEISPLTIKVK